MDSVNAVEIAELAYGQALDHVNATPLALKARLLVSIIPNRRSNTTETATQQKRQHNRKANVAEGAGWVWSETSYTTPERIARSPQEQR